MTGTSVKGVGNVLNVFPKTAGSAEKGMDFGFQEVFNNQTGKDIFAKEETVAGESLKTKESKKVEKPLQRESDRIKPSMTEGNVSKRVSGEELSEEELEEAMAVLNGTMQQLLKEIAELFGLSEEQLQGMLEQLGVESTEILNPENMSELLLLAGGAEDSFSLLTNADLYENYRTMMERLNALLQQAGEELGMEPKELTDLIAKGAMSEIPGQMPQETIPIEVTVEKPVSETEEHSEALTENTVGGNMADDAENAPEIKTAQTTGKDGQESGSAKDEAGQRTENREAGNLFLQNLRSDSFNGQVQQLAGDASAWNADTQDIMRQILDYMKIQIKPGETTLEMQLHPESLGTVHVQIAAKGGALTAHFVTQNEAVKAALEGQMVQLKESFHEQGVKVEVIEVTVQTHEFERSFDENRGGSQADAHRKQKSRRIHLNESLDLENPEDEEILEAQMMSAQGATVNFTA